MDWTFAWRRRRISRELVVHPEPRRQPRKPAFAVVGIVEAARAADSTTLLFVVVDAVGVLFSHVRNGKTLETKFLNPPPNALVSFIFFSSFFAANFSVLASMFAIHLDAQFFLYSSSSSRFFSSSSNLAFSSAAALSSASFFAFALASFFALIAAFLASSSASAFASAASRVPSPRAQL